MNEWNDAQRSFREAAERVAAAIGVPTVRVLLAKERQMASIHALFADNSLEVMAIADPLEIDERDWSIQLLATGAYAPTLAARIAQAGHCAVEAALQSAYRGLMTRPRKDTA